MNNVKVDAGSKWANPFKVGRMFPMMDERSGRLKPVTPQSEEECLTFYRLRWEQHIKLYPQIIREDFQQLLGTKLVCDCKKGCKCHKQILQEIIHQHFPHHPQTHTQL